MLRRASLALVVPALMASSGYIHRERSADCFHEDVDAPVAAALGTLGAVSPMVEPRSGHSATLLPNGKVLIAGGMRRNQDFYSSAELYDPATGTFSLTGSMVVATVGNVAVLLKSGKVLVVGGWVRGSTTDLAEVYDPATGKFSDVGRMTTKRARPEASLLTNGDVLITGGQEHDSRGGIATAELYHAANGNFEALVPMHLGRIAHTSTVLNDGRVLIAGGIGEKDGVVATAELYDPSTKTFVPTGKMVTPRIKHCSGLLPDGRVLLAGGSGDSSWTHQLASAEIYDPRTGQFTSAAPLDDPRFKLPDEAATLPGGRLLFAGGSKTLDIYDPASGRFLAVNDQLPDVRHYMSETRLADGSVLLTGGYPDNDQATAAAWIYRP
jgi:Galactose oxidase, central domain/Kelch motif